jgi:hypothetical protein
MFDRSKAAAARRRAPLVICLTSVLSIAGAIGLPSDASAYNLEGQKWGGTPSSGCCANLGVQYNNVAQSYDSTGLYLGFLSWNHSFGSGVNVQISAVTSSPWTVQDTYNSGVSWDGLTSLQIGLDLNFSAAALVMNSYYTGTYAQAVVNGVAAHEIGHSLGLAHNNDCVLMQPSTILRTVCNVFGPVQDDKNGVNSLY